MAGGKKHKGGVIFLEHLPGRKYKIYTVAIDKANVQGCRITPNVYTTPKELDQFVNALSELATV